MSIQNSNHKDNQANSNKGTSGNNPANAKVHGNRGISQALSSQMYNLFVFCN